MIGFVEGLSAKISTLEVKKTQSLKYLFMAIVFLFWTSLYFYVPTLPLYAKTKTEDMGLIGTILSMYGLWQAAVRLPLGIVNDWLGRRKPFILAGAALAGIGALVMGLANSAGVMIIGRSITGLAAAAWVPMVVVFSSLYPPKDAVRASVVLTLINSFACMLASSLNGTLNNLGGFPLAFFIGAGVSLITLFTVLAAREEPRPPQRRSWSSVRELVTRREVLLPSALSAVAQYGVWATIYGFLPLLAQRLGASDILLGLFVSMNIGIVLIGNLLTSLALRYIRARSMVYFSYLLLAVGILVASFAVALPSIFIASILIGLSAGINYPILMGMSIERVHESERATAMGVYQSVYGIGMFVGPWLSGVLAAGVGIQPMFAMTGFFCLVLGLLGTSWLVQPIVIQED